MERLSDVQNLVMQLYEALHVNEHQLKKERQLLTQLEQLHTQLLPLEEVPQDHYFSFPLCLSPMLLSSLTGSPDGVGGHHLFCIY